MYMAENLIGLRKEVSESGEFAKYLKPSLLLGITGLK